ncbi:MAG: DUF2726 domain-containing protein [Betaproteobacteria bacterium]|nr:MAG: DUF2726 domain-containing protein [Betaproteobacteria bacterium]
MRDRHDPIKTAKRRRKGACRHDFRNALRACDQRAGGRGAFRARPAAAERREVEPRGRVDQHHRAVDRGRDHEALSSAELPGLYLLRSRFLSKAESVVYLLLKAAFPRHEIFARVRLADVLQVKIGPQGMERLRAFRKIANQHVGFVVCDRDMTIVAIVDSKEPEQVQNPRDQKLEIIKQRCLQAAQVKYMCVYPPTLPRYRELREQILGPAADLV